VFARITTFYTADPSPHWEPELFHRLTVRALEVVPKMDGFVGGYGLMDRKSGKALTFTLWESEEAMQRAEEALRPLRKEIAEALSGNIVDVERYEVSENLVQETHERELVEQELRVARSIQQASLPKEVPQLPGWQISPYYRPARAVGGDFYDFHPLPEGRLGVVVGDATGKGVPAALVMSTTCGMLQLAAQALDSASPGEVLERVNETLLTRIPLNVFVTCFYAILDPKRASLSYANAGHDLPYLRRRGGDCEELRARGMPLGLMSKMSYEEREAPLGEGDSVLFYSDGLVEAHDPKGEMFGFPRLRALLAEHAEEERPLGEFLMEELYSFVGQGWEQEDDITLLTLERSPIRT
jgi:serine phosphatase RsbU (regulator of sigma subunit)